jgi:hypothetical protein
MRFAAGRAQLDRAARRRGAGCSGSAPGPEDSKSRRPSRAPARAPSPGRRRRRSRRSRRNASVRIMLPPGSGCSQAEVLLALSCGGMYASRRSAGSRAATRPPHLVDSRPARPAARVVDVEDPDPVGLGGRGSPAGGRRPAGAATGTATRPMWRSAGSARASRRRRSSRRAAARACGASAATRARTADRSARRTAETVAVGQARRARRAVTTLAMRGELTAAIHVGPREAEARLVVAEAVLAGVEPVVVEPAARAGLLGDDPWKRRYMIPLSRWSPWPRIIDTSGGRRRR